MRLKVKYCTTLYNIGQVAIHVYSMKKNLEQLY